MKTYRIGWLPGDGVGKEVMEATTHRARPRRVRRRVRARGHRLGVLVRGGRMPCPPRTIDLLQNVDAAMFGAITSKPVKDAEKELVPALQGKGLVYRSPIVRMRQLFDLYVCLRPCKAYPHNPLNYKEGIDLVVFRENTEDLYAGVEFAPGAGAAARRRWRSCRRPSSPSTTCPATTTPSPARSTRGRAPSASSARPSSSPGSSERKKVTVVHKANVVRATDGLFLETARQVAKDYPRHRRGRRQHRCHDDVAAEEPVQLRRAGRAEPLRRHHLRPVRADGRRPRVRLLGQHRREARGLRADARLGAEVRRACTRSIRSPPSWRPR